MEKLEIKHEKYKQKWIDVNNNIIKIDRKNKIFQKIAAKEYKEISDQNLDLTKIKNLETRELYYFLNCKYVRDTFLK